jgi:hypothetical protein
MCVICETKDAMELAGLERLECRNCVELREIPKELVNLRELKCHYCINITEIPKELVKLEKVQCDGCSIVGIPKELVNLKELVICNKKLSKTFLLPESLTSLTYL